MQQLPNLVKTWCHSRCFKIGTHWDSFLSVPIFDPSNELLAVCKPQMGVRWPGTHSHNNLTLFGPVCGSAVHFVTETPVTHHPPTTHMRTSCSACYNTEVFRYWYWLQLFLTLVHIKISCEHAAAEKTMFGSWTAGNDSSFTLIYPFIRLTSASIVQDQHLLHT